jgi:hypothetical protein
MQYSSDFQLIFLLPAQLAQNRLLVAVYVITKLLIKRK